MEKVIKQNCSFHSSNFRLHINFILDFSVVAREYLWRATPVHPLRLGVVWIDGHCPQCFVAFVKKKRTLDLLKIDSYTGLDNL